MQHVKMHIPMSHFTQALTFMVSNQVQTQVESYMQPYEAEANQIKAKHNTKECIEAYTVEHKPACLQPPHSTEQSKNKKSNVNQTLTMTIWVAYNIPPFDELYSSHQMQIKETKWQGETIVSTWKHCDAKNNSKG